MANVSYVSEQPAKTGLNLSRQAIRRSALALAGAGATYFGYDYLTTGRCLETTDDAYIKADSTIIAPKACSRSPIASMAAVHIRELAISFHEGERS